MSVLRALRAYRDVYSGLGAGVWRISAVTFVHRAGTMVLPFLVLYSTEELGTTPREAGFLLSLYGVGSLLGAWIGGRWTDRWGEMPAMTVSLVSAGGLFLALEHCRTPWVFGLVIVPTALAAESFRPSSAAALARLARPENRARVFALRRLAINAGMTLGPAAGGWLAVVDWAWLFRIDGATCLVAAVVLRLLLPRGVGGPGENGGANDEESASPLVPAASVWTDRPYLLLMGAVSALSIVFLQLLSTWPLTLRDVHGLDEPAIGLLFAVNTFVIVLLEMPLVRSVEAMAPLRVAAVGSIFLAAGLGTLPWASGYVALVGTVVLWTIGEMLVFPVLESFAAGRAPAARRGEYLGLYTACFSVASLVGPIVGTQVYGMWGSDALWILCGGGSVVLAAWLAGLDRSGRFEVVEES